VSSQNGGPALTTTSSVFAPWFVTHQVKLGRQARRIQLFAVMTPGPTSPEATPGRGKAHPDRIDAHSRIPRLSGSAGSRSGFQDRPLQKLAVDP
jgi:hypothetical protein